MGRAILQVCAAAIFLMLLFPPFVFHSSTGDFNLGYAFILDPPALKDGVDGTVNASTLVSQWLGVILVGSLLAVSDRISFISLSKPKPGTPHL